ncbi:MAG TPA: WXG100 family type VII secretion target [Caldilinea sp.]|nr:WXG100 family type VII secretion target [Anaerolineales bacterium]HRA66868.1 WXG100 family type VII secretion target [Caldilinea sp.]
MSNEIRGVYGDLEQVASRFANAQSEVADTFQRVRAAMDPLENGSWIGRGSDAFVREMRGEVLPAVQRLQQSLGEAARTTGAIVQALRQADEEASSPFRTT